jgi:predicted ester cyclase
VTRPGRVRNTLRHMATSHIANEISINGSIEPVYDLVTTTRYWPQWHPATESVGGVTDRPLAVGDQVRERAVLGTRVHEGTWTVTEQARPTRLVLQIDGGRLEIAYQFTTTGSTTTLRRELRFDAADFAGLGADAGTVEARMLAQSEEALRRLKIVAEMVLRLEHNKQVSRRILEDAFNAGKLEAVVEGFLPDARIHDPGTDFHGPEHLRQGLAGLRAAFPDFHFTVLDQVAEDDRVVIRYRGQGTHSAEFLGIPASGRAIDYTGLLYLRVAGEQIAEFWAQPDQLGLLKQLGGRVVTDSAAARG